MAKTKSTKRSTTTKAAEPSTAMAPVPPNPLNGVEPNNEIGLNVQLTTDKLATIHVDEYEVQLTLEARELNRNLQAAVLKHQTTNNDLHNLAVALVGRQKNELAEQTAMAAGQYYKIVMSVSYTFSQRNDGSKDVQYVIRISAAQPLNRSGITALPEVYTTVPYDEEMLKKYDQLVEDAKVVGNIQKLIADNNEKVRDLPLLRKASSAQIARTIAERVAPELMQNLDQAVGTATQKLIGSK